MLLLLFALSMLVPWATSYYQRDGVVLVADTMGLTALLGVALWWGLFAGEDWQPRQVILVTVAWVSLPVRGPAHLGVMFVQGAPTVTHAYLKPP